jgi:hypothetical protein
VTDTDTPGLIIAGILGIIAGILGAGGAILTQIISSIATGKRDAKRFAWEQQNQRAGEARA